MASLSEPPFGIPALDPLGYFIEAWQRWFLQLKTQLTIPLQASLTLIGNYAASVTLTGVTNITFPTAGTLLTTTNVIGSFALAAQPTLGAGDAGAVYRVTDYRHLVFWDGTAWQWADGDQPYRLADFTSAPGTGWGLCDGTVYAMLVVSGATLTTANFTSPNLTATPSYRKSAAAYTGTLNPSSGTTGTGTTGSEAAHTHETAAIGPLTTSPENSDPAVVAAGAQTSPAVVHTHTVTIPIHSSGGGTAHSHSVPALAVGSLDMPNLAVLPYVRR